MQYISDSITETYIFENSKLDCICIIVKNLQRDLPGLGGTRFIAYDNFDQAVEDAKLLANTMLLKCIAADLPFTGAKQVIFTSSTNISPEHKEAILTFSAQCINELKGNFITGTDMGISIDDVNFMYQTTPYILHGKGADTAIDTATGVLLSFYEVMKIFFDDEDFKILLQGFGKVGSNIAFALHDDFNVNILEVDSNKKNLLEENNFNLLEDLKEFNADIFMPCASAKVVSIELMQSLEIKAIIGCANNQLKSEDEDLKLFNANIIYAPDFLVNSGGIISAAASYLQWSEDEKNQRIRKIPKHLKKILDSAARDKIGTNLAAKLYFKENF